MVDLFQQPLIAPSRSQQSEMPRVATAPSSEMGILRRVIDPGRPFVSEDAARGILKLSFSAADPLLFQIDHVIAQQHGGEAVVSSTATTLGTSFSMAGRDSHWLDENRQGHDTSPLHQRSRMSRCWLACGNASPMARRGRWVAPQRAKHRQTSDMSCLAEAIRPQRCCR